jgi:GDP-D-mannose 3',5'-epimerase
MNRTVMVAGAGGFIGGWLTKRLLEMGRSVRAVDVKPLAEWEQLHTDAENLVLDLRDRSDCTVACSGIEHVFNLACDMGGMGFIELNKTACMLSVVIGANLLEAASRSGVSKFFFSSTACVYNIALQSTLDVIPLREEDAYPADPEDGYGWEKLFMERLCRHVSEDFSMKTCVARLHNVYGPFCTWEGGREKAPAALCRKAVEAKYNNHRNLEIWGDGDQKRSFTHIDDCTTGIMRIMESDVYEPLNLGSDQVISINELVAIIEQLAGITFDRRYILDAPLGVRGRCSDNTKIFKKLGWAPSLSIADNLATTYEWIENQYQLKYMK